MTKLRLPLYIAHLYFFIGVIISLFYTWLSGGKTTCFLVTMGVSPVVCLFTIIALSSLGLTNGQVHLIENQGVFTLAPLEKKEKRITLLILVYLASPIILRAVAYIFRILHNAPIANYIYDYRYWPLAIVPTIVLLATTVMAKQVQTPPIDLQALMRHLNVNIPPGGGRQTRRRRRG